MKHLLLTLLLMLPFALRAQSANPAMWCPAGATWTYGYHEMSGSGTVTVRYVRDTLVAGQPAQLLSRRVQPCYTLGPGCVPGAACNLAGTITRVVATRVEVWAHGQFYTLYDFGAPVGSTWLTPLVIPSGPCPQSSGIGTVRVDSVGTQQIGGRTLRWFRARLTAPAGVNYLGYWPGRIYEQLGNVAAYMQPQSPACPYTDPGYMGSLSSFQASAWPTISYNATNGTLLGSTGARDESAGFSVYPNPSAGAIGLTLRLPAATTGGATLELIDLAGRQIISRKAVEGFLLDVRGLAAGAYLLQLREPGQPVITQRILLQ